MNQRILELARQVWPDPNTSHVNHEKFAELIVRECALALDKTIAPTSHPFNSIGWRL